jgi:GntR family transcriptional repressor for pyruvate dehydrogenase complex
MLISLAAPADEAPLAAGSLSDRLAGRLAALIDAGTLAPGDRLPTEPQLCALHGVSRTVVREAVQRLKSRGLLLSRQGSGVFVAATAVQQPLAFDARLLESVDTVAQIVEVRRALEGEIAALAAERASRLQLAAIRRALKAIESAAQAGGDGVDQDIAFHRSIAQASGNPQFGRLLDFLGQYLRQAMRVTRGHEARHQVYAQAVRDEHEAIVEAIAARDGAAARRSATRHMVQAACRLAEGGLVPAARTASQAAPRVCRP